MQDHLGQKLRGVYAQVTDKPAYLGDPALPPEFEHRLLEIDKASEIHDKGIDAVTGALGVSQPAREQGVSAVQKALGVEHSPRDDGNPAEDDEGPAHGG